MFKNKTILGATETTEGFIKHFSYNGIECPVRIKLKEKVLSGRGVKNVSDSDKKGLPSPLRINGVLAYALPGGGFVLGDK